MKIKFNITFSDQKGQPMEKYILNDTGQKSFMKKKNPLLQPTNVTEGKKQHNSTTNSANNIVPIDKTKVNQNNFDELKEKAKKVSILHFLTESKTKHRYVCPFCGSVAQVQKGQAV